MHEQKTQTWRFHVSDAEWIRRIQHQIERCREETLLKAAQVRLLIIKMVVR